MDLDDYKLEGSGCYYHGDCDVPTGQAFTYFFIYVSGLCIVVQVLLLIHYIYSSQSGPSTAEEAPTPATIVPYPPTFNSTHLMILHYRITQVSFNREAYEDCLQIFRNNCALLNIPLPPYGYTAFLKACMISHSPLVEEMIKSGADITAKTVDDDSAIFLATFAFVSKRSENFDTLAVLVEAGCDVNEQKSNTYTPLHLAARFGCDQLVYWLLLHGANPVTPGCLYSPYGYALKYGHPFTARMLRAPDTANNQ